ncbi:MAG TPA: ABC transporter permease [Firmicutes bacterium]|nr:ABC transporter permease [Bacillota bacterium]
MKQSFYPKLAWTGIRKNKRLYTPYILTCIGMVIMFYIMSFLSTSDVLQSMPGGDTMQAMLDLGCGVIGFFALIFLFYTNSFLIRRRKKEIGLYNILGMGKWNLAGVLFWETVMIAGISLASGLLFGIVFSKIAELGMVNILGSQVTFTLSLEPKAIVQVLALFAVIFTLILLNNLRQIHLSNPIELLHSENAGEKKPKANWILALMGFLILSAAYYLAVTIEDPISTMVWFFVAVIMVITATYLLFIAGSIAVCKLLQKNKRYYYKTNHFVSVSSMIYRMKRNGAGLASICILCTMVLVMVSSTVCLYIGAEDSLRSRYPRNISLDSTASSMEGFVPEQVQAVKELTAKTVEDHGQTAENPLDYHVAAFAGYFHNGTFQTEPSSGTLITSAYQDMWQVFVVSLDDYNRLMGQEEQLEEGEALAYSTKSDFRENSVSIMGKNRITVKKFVPDFADNGIDSMQIVPSLYLFVPDVEQVVAPLEGEMDNYENPILTYHWFYGFDLNCADDAQILISNEIQEGLHQPIFSQGDFSISCESVAQERAGFYGLYGGLFFLGILLGIVFIFAAVLIIYYKQISEGYEDQSRFEIMQKVGMTRKEIKKSINSQVLTVFFLPLLAAGVHLAFAFPMLSKMLALFSLTNTTLLILVTVCCYLVFAVFYIFVYRITSRSYYTIVSGIQKEHAAK